MPLNFSEPGKIVVPLTRIIADGDKRLRQIVGFAVVDQMNVINMYEGQGGFVSDIENAVDIRGPAGKSMVEPGVEVIEVEGDPGPPGQSAYELWLAAGNSGTVQDFFNALKGADATLGDVRLAVAQYLTDFPPAAGKDATPEQIAAAVEQWLTTNPPKDGEDGQNATDAMVANAVELYLLAHPPADGEDGKDATPQMVADQVSAYLTANPPARGLPGTNGKSVELQIASGFIQWRQTDGSWANLVDITTLKGNPGNNGKSVELQKTATAIQWRLVGDTAWTNLVTLAEIKGDKGNPGAITLGELDITETAVVALALGQRTLAVNNIPASWGMLATDNIMVKAVPTQANPNGMPAGYSIPDFVPLSATSGVLNFMGPLLALLATRTFRLRFIAVGR